MISRATLSRAKNHALRVLGYDFEHWARVEQIRHWKEVFGNISTSEKHALEVSPGTRSTWTNMGFKSYTATNYPEFDICTMTTTQQYDIIIADNVFEHLEFPVHAGKNVFTMLNNDGIFFIATPFLIRIHGEPQDFTRWTVDGLNRFLQDIGFDSDHLIVTSWGNRKCVKANFIKWAHYGWYRDLTNEEHFPVVVWAIARKTAHRG